MLDKRPVDTYAPPDKEDESYKSMFGNCINAKEQLGFLSNDVQDCASYFLGDTVLNGVAKPPIAAPLVYWLGGNSPITAKQGFKDLFIAAHEKTRDEYIHFSFHHDFNDWFSV